MSATATKQDFGTSPAGSSRTNSMSVSGAYIVTHAAGRGSGVQSTGVTPAIAATGVTAGHERPKYTTVAVGSRNEKGEFGLGFVIKYGGRKKLGSRRRS